jgi:predicted site-specific integrase-resolvase
MSHSPVMPDDAPLAYRVKPGCKRLGISEATFFKYKALGKIKTIKIGKRVLIPATEVARILEEGVR